MNYLLALVPALTWGSIGLVQKKAGGKPTIAAIGSMTGFLILSIIITIIYHNFVDTFGFLMGMLSGACLAFANVGQFTGMNELGVSKAVPLVAAQQLIINTLLGAFLFHSWTNPVQWVLGIIAIVLVIIGAQFTNFEEHKTSSSGASRSGMIGVLIAGIFGGLYAFIPNAYKFYSKVQGGTDFSLAIMLPQAIGGMIGALILYFVLDKRNPFTTFKDKFLWRNTSVGILWAIGNLTLMVVSTGKLGLATAYTFSQLNLVVASLEGILILREKKTKKEMIYVLIGNIAVIAGAVITALI